MNIGLRTVLEWFLKLLDFLESYGFTWTGFFFILIFDSL
jgi:hypothetical protein